MAQREGATTRCGGSGPGGQSAKFVHLSARFWRGVWPMDPPAGPHMGPMVGCGAKYTLWPALRFCRGTDYACFLLESCSGWLANVCYTPPLSCPPSPVPPLVADSSDSFCFCYRLAHSPPPPPSLRVVLAPVWSMFHHVVLLHSFTSVFPPPSPPSLLFSCVSRIAHAQPPIPLSL